MEVDGSLIPRPHLSDGVVQESLGCTLVEPQNSPPTFARNSLKWIYPSVEEFLVENANLVY